jgi:hypothetical protein
VIIITLIPAVLQSLMAGLTSALTGSLIATIPIRVAFCSKSSYFEISLKSYVLLSWVI